MSVSPQKIIDELVAIAFARATDYLHTSGDTLVIRDTDQLPSNAGAAIAGIEKSSTGLKVKFYDKLKALEMLGRCTGAFDKKQDPGANQNNLLDMLLKSTQGEVNTDDLPELH